MLVDGGSGTMQRLARLGIDGRKLDAGVYSHRHVDHCGDLVPLLFAMRVGPDEPRRGSYPIWAGSGFTGFLEDLEAVYGAWIRTDKFRASVVELPLTGPGQAALPGGVRLDTLPARHAAGALHLRFTGPDGYSVTFSGDTGPNENLALLAAGCDVLVTECATAEPDPWYSHLCPNDVLEVVKAARPRRVVLTHLYPGLDSEDALRHVAEAGVPVERGYDGLVLERLFGA